MNSTTLTFRAEVLAYVVWGGLIGLPLIPFALVLRKFGWVGFVAKGMLVPTLLIIAILAFLFFWLSRFRLVFESASLTYNMLFGSTWSVPYTAIRDITASRVTPIEKLPIGAYVHLENGDKKLVYLKVFSRSAAKRLFELAARP